MSALRGAEPSIFGVDFSGAANAGEAIWVARCRMRSQGPVEVVSCEPAMRLPDGGRRRDEAMAALRRLIRNTGEGAIVGMDFPFGLPAPVTTQLFGDIGWTAFLTHFAERFADEHGFREACQHAAGGRELKRQTDREAQTPFSPYNLRLFRQTYYGLRDVLAPLVRAEAVCCPPMQTVTGDAAILVEVCPASTLKRMRAVHGETLSRPYKGRGEDRRNARRTLLEALVSTGAVRIGSGDLCREILDNAGGDALDAVIAATAARRALSGAATGKTAPTENASVEGWVYC